MAERLTRRRIGLALIALALSLSVLSLLRRPPSAPPPVAEPDAPAESLAGDRGADPVLVEPGAGSNPADESGPGGRGAPANERSSVDAAEDAARTDGPPVVEGYVFDLLGRGVPAVRVRGDRDRGEPDRFAESDADGRFHLAARPGHDVLRVHDETWFTLRFAVLTPTNRRAQHAIVVAPWAEVAGRVINGQGRPVQARVRLVLTREALDRIPHVLDHTRESAGLQVTCAEDGGFRFEGLPLVPGAVLRATHDEYRDVEIPAPAARTRDLLIRMEEEAVRGAEPVVSGRVLHADGRAASNARVQLGWASTFTDAAGEFRMHVQGRLGEAEPLVATLRGFEPAVREGFGAKLTGGRSVEGVTLILPGEALTIAGRVVTAEGEPCEGWLVRLNSGTALNPGRLPPLFAEDFAASLDPEASSRRHASRAPGQVETDGKGAFELGGLRRGERYTLRAWKRETLQVAESEPVPAGTRDVRLIVSASPRPVVFGVVRGLDGMPLEHVRVRLTLVEYSSGSSKSYHTGQELHTPSDGSFSFESVPHNDLLLRFTGPEVDSLYFELAADDPGTDLDIRLTRRCHLRFQGIGGPGGADVLKLLDEDGSILRMSRIEAGRSSSTTSLQLENGRSGLVAVSERARWLVLYRGDEEIGRRRLRPTPDETLLIRE